MRALSQRTLSAASRSAPTLPSPARGGGLGRRLLGWAVRVALAILVVSLGIARPAFAQDVTPSSGYQFFVTPYLWMPSVHATTKTPLAREPEVNSNVSFIDLLSHLNGAPFMGSGEVRYGPLGVLADGLHLPVSTSIT